MVIYYEAIDILTYEFIHSKFVILTTEYIII